MEYKQLNNEVELNQDEANKIMNNFIESQGIRDRSNDNSYYTHKAENKALANDMSKYFAIFLKKFSVKEVIDFYQHRFFLSSNEHKLGDIIKYEKNKNLLFSIIQDSSDMSRDIKDFGDFMKDRQDTLVSMMNFRNKEGKNIIHAAFDRSTNPKNIFELLKDVVPMLKSENAINSVKNMFMENYTFNKNVKSVNLLDYVIKKAIESNKSRNTGFELEKDYMTKERFLELYNTESVTKESAQNIGELLNTMKDKLNFSEQEINKMIPNGEVDFKNKTIEIGANNVFSDEIVINF